MRPSACLQELAQRRNRCGSTPLGCAINADSRPCVEALMPHCDAAVREAPNTGAQPSLLMWAVAQKHTDLALLLLGQGASANERMSGSRTLLVGSSVFSSVQQCFVQCVEQCVLQCVP